ncbi:MAG: hypothetical protein E6K54_07370 [Gammaproteobacteria bacterium]|nr:MAG: hypothetical protein E6K54_07370 [Gammaproteobacteria bacterium]
MFLNYEKNISYVSSIQEGLPPNTCFQSTLYLKKTGGLYQIFASDGDFFEECIGSYNINDSTSIKFDNKKLSYWLMIGAIPTLEVINIISIYLEIEEASNINMIINKLKHIKTNLKV